ncbi:para-nitrobenzyl esterase [Aliivibrio sp. 1S165]|uniref:carboxylesterase family protein n=1 Tax=unclassified Aliivibrio TaxID=2645654 RepID=UPI00080EDBF1|nr:MULTISPECIES: carboxylesterase family protein [unclassified Aliivibrio]OCH18821.1 para-nitrobenzyl esterase [Aliivibrio sp. 1S165]OCH30985.1 para-nitrobenzyl esterase [Aliivibrio sp. 1S175]
MTKTLIQHSLLALSVSVVLSACNSEEETTVIPSEPLPLLPLPPQQITIEFEHATLRALQESVVITTQTGDESLVAIETFKGVNYASADRFAHSVTSELAGNINATKFGDACPQVVSTQQVQSEDCLNLNIWRPEGTYSGDHLPVYVFIHGGDFEQGSASDAITQGDTVVAQGIDDGNPFLMVSINYRLGILGSLWTEQPEGGNFAIGDQKRALEWINQHITEFGGNPANVTVMGQGAGAMSIGILQQTEGDDVVSGSYIQRAIMQSNPYGFDYQNYGQAKKMASKINDYSSELFATEALDSLSVDEIMQLQSKVLDPIERIGAWTGLDCIDTDKIDYGATCVISKISNEITPIATLMPFAPYVEYYKPLFGSANEGLHVTTQPMETALTIPTVLGVNADEANTVSMLPMLTFLIPTLIELISEDAINNDALASQSLQVSTLQQWLAQEDNVERLQDELSALTVQDASTKLAIEDLLGDLPSSAYEAVSKLFLGLGNSETNNELLALTDFYPNSESTLGGAGDNMSQFKSLVNAIVFAGPARLKAKQSDDNNVPVSFYHFNYRPSFNVWSFDNEINLGITDLLKSISCISGACHGSELPFVFNKAFKLDGMSVHPSDQDKTLMNKLSRVWFSDQLFDNYQYSEALDSVMVIESTGKIMMQYDWDSATQSGIDPKLRNGLLNGLEDEKLLIPYLYQSK